MPTMYTNFDAAKAALQIHGGFLVEISLDREFWLAADYIDAVEILTWAGGSREQAFNYLIAHPGFTDGSVVRSTDYIESL